MVGKFYEFLTSMSTQYYHYSVFGSNDSSAEPPEPFIFVLKNDIYHFLFQVLVIYEHLFIFFPPQLDCECFWLGVFFTLVSPTTQHSTWHMAVTQEQSSMNEK